MAVEAHDLSIEDAPATSQVARQALAQAGEALEGIALPGHEPHAVLVGVQQRPEAVQLDLKEPVQMAKRVADTAERHWLELREGH